MDWKSWKREVDWTEGKREEKRKRGKAERALTCVEGLVKLLISHLSRDLRETLLKNRPVVLPEMIAQADHPFPEKGLALVDSLIWIVCDQYNG